MPLLVVAILGILVLSFASVPMSSSLTPSISYGLVSIITPPKVIESSDISWVDNSTQLYFLSDRTNCGVDVVNTTDDQYVTTLPANRPACGPNGVTFAPDLKEVWFGDANSSVKAYNMTVVSSPTLIANVSTGGTGRADELAYDQKDHIIMVGNSDDTPPFETEISATNMTVLGRIMINSTNGVEQPAWDSANDMFYVSVPASNANPGGEVDVINPMTMQVVNIFPTIPHCTPHGLAIGPQQQAAIGCNNVALYPYQSEIMNLTSGAATATITQVGGSDEVWYNPGDGHYYFTGATTADGIKGGGRASVAVIGVVDANSNTWIENIILPNSAHLSADPLNNQLYVTITGVGIGVIAQPSSQVSGLDMGSYGLLMVDSQVSSLTSVVSSLKASETQQLSKSIVSLNSQLATTTTTSNVAISAVILALILGAYSVVVSRRASRPVEGQ